MRPIAACLLALLLVGCGGSGPSSSPPGSKPSQAPDLGGRVAFSAEGPDSDDIYIRSLDGSTIDPLTESPAKEWDPDISPDGSRIAYRVNPDPDSDHADIWVMNADGSGATNLTSDAALDNWAPAWSPDGSRILFTSAREGSGLHLWTMTPAGEDLRQVTEGWGEYGDWSPDGSSVVFAAPTGGTYDIWTASVEGGTATQLTETPATEFFPAWSPDGRWIAFSRDLGERWVIVIIAPDGSGERQVSLDDGSGPFWLADGRLGWDGPGGLHLADPDGGEAAILPGAYGRLGSWGSGG